MSNDPVSPRVLSPKVQEKIRSVYEEAMWLAKRGDHGVTAGNARYWANHRLSHMARQLRLFTGYVSRAAIDNPGQRLILEHHQRMDTTVTDFIQDHVTRELYDPEAFIDLVAKLDSVHIVTDEENHAIQTHKGDYPKAGVTLVPWNRIDRDRQEALWASKVKGKVSNWRMFRPGSNEWCPRLIAYPSA